MGERRWYNFNLAAVGEHDPQDGLIGFPHTFPGQAAYIADRFICALGDDAVTAEDLLVAARKLYSKISRATVYRALPDLIRSGILSELNVGRDFKYYESTRNAGTFKGHIVCTNCDKIIEFDAPFMDWYGRAIAEKNGLTFITQHLQITARCPNCNCQEQDNGTSKNSTPATQIRKK